ncbi:YfjI family protein [Endozoicomonas sp. Mp262]|uniref:YfjI family protein n=1 Tax=Endozoicomonas sp. Mp262 TaxID=2919499 RepID=UPI0021D7FB78
MALCDTQQVTVINPDDTSEELQKVSSQPTIEWPELRLLTTNLLPVEPITPDMLPNELRGWLTDLVERMDNAPFDYAAIASMVSLASLIGRKAGVQPKQFDDWTIIPNLWGCCIGRPSQKKTPVIKAVTKPLARLEVEARTEQKETLKRYQAQEKITQMAMKEAEKKAMKLISSGKVEEAEALLLDDSSDPEKPVCQRYIVNDATIEKLGILLSENPQGLLLLRDELSGWISGLNRHDRQQDRSFWLEAFNGDGSFSYDRITRDDVFIPSNTVSLLGGIQPGRLLPLLMSQHDGSGDDGLVERFQLLVYPDKPTFRHTDRKPDKACKEQAEKVFNRLSEIPFEEDENSRTALRFDEQGQEVFNHWYCELMARINNSNIDLHMESHLSKYPALMPALAMIFHVIQHGISGNISKQSAELAVRWCDVLETHARRVYGLVNDPMASARILADRLNKLPASFKMADLERKRWVGLLDVKEREQALHWLEVHGYIVKKISQGNGRPSITYHTNPACLADKETEKT